MLQVIAAFFCINQKPIPVRFSSVSSAFLVARAGRLLYNKSNREGAAMNKKWAVLTCGFLLAASTTAFAAGINGEYKGHPIVQVVVNGKTVSGEVPGINMDGTTLVPLRVVSEALGAQVEWDQATATASVTLAAQPVSPKPGEADQQQEDAEKNELLKKLDQLSGKALKYAEQLADLRERISIAKQYYDIRKEDYRIASMNEGFWKTFTDQYDAMFEAIEDLQEAGNRYHIDRLELVKAVQQTQTAFSSYKMSVEHLKQYVATGNNQFLEFYILSYSQAFEEELKAREMAESLAQHIPSS
jgi:hypothetical protein